MASRFVLIALLAGCSADAAAPRQDSAQVQTPESSAAHVTSINPRVLRRFRPVRADLASPALARTTALVDLGRMLYFDARLSKDQTQSCNTCHPLDRYGADGKSTSPGHNGQLGARNTPTTYHSAGLVSQFWDGRSPDVEHQAERPLTNPKEMASTPQEIVATLSSMRGYVEQFAAAFPGKHAPITMEQIGLAIGAFERGLVASAPWDRYLNGDVEALSAEQLEGLRIFIDVGCIGCHTGEMVGGTSLQKLGQVVAWPNTNDHGRFEVTHAQTDDMMFRVPTLRNVAMTGPYFHDGGTSSLEEAIRLMGKHQLGVDLVPRETAAIAAWLTTLTGTLPTDYIRAPVLPAARM